MTREELEKLPITFVLQNECTKYKYKIKLNCTGDVYYELDDEYDNFVSSLEHQYGVLDCSGHLTDDGWEVGYQSYEIEKRNFKVVKDEFKKFFKNKGLLR